ncbi:MAG TPA: hypothetical protein VFT72_15540 [Opitutaceae bacterium]|nr:hypothetical protein [Opitutaceae bacterium]
MSCARSTWSVLLLASAASLFADDPRTTPNANAIEAARQELQNLPATESAVHPQTALDIHIPISNFAGTPGEQRPSQTPRLDETKSEGWLVDGFKMSQDRDTAARLAAESKIEARADAKRATSGRNRPDLMAQMMQSWLSPETRSLLKTDAQKTGALGHESEAFSADDTRSKFSVDAAPRYAAHGSGRVGMAAALPNPYLTAQNEPLPSSLAQSPAPSSLQPTMTAADGQRDAQRMLPSALAYPQEHDNRGLRPATSASARASLENDLPPPTKPLIDEQRYFPQLRRF